MELFYTGNSLEERICNIAYLNKIPIGGAFELLPVCNMNCKMCYIHTTETNKDAKDKILSGDEWITLAERMKKEGLLFLLLTGGEPLLHPEFDKIYASMAQMGIFLSINTNGTLLEQKLSLLTKIVPRQVNVSLYGACRETYESLCGYGDGFDKVISAVKELKLHNVQVRFSLSMSPYNIHEMDSMVKLCNDLDIPFVFNHHMFPPARCSGIKEDYVRFTAKEHVDLWIKGKKLQYPEMDLKEQAALLKKEMKQFRQNENSKIFQCRAGHNGFWVNWKGELMPCGMIDTPTVSLLKNDFSVAWKIIREHVEHLYKPYGCKTCEKKNICYVCAAHYYTENRAYDMLPEYICETMDYIIKYLGIDDIT